MWFKSNGSVANCSCSRALTAGDSNRALEFSSRQKRFCCKGASDDDKLSKVRITVRGAGGCACTRLLPPEDREGKGLWAHKSQIKSAASSCFFFAVSCYAHTTVFARACSRQTSSERCLFLLWNNGGSAMAAAVIAPAQAARAFACDGQ